MSIFNQTTIAQMPLISILLAFLCIWMITFLVLALRSTTKKSAEQELMAAEPAPVKQPPTTPVSEKQRAVNVKQTTTNEAPNYVALNEQDVAQVAGATN